jgi:hypothetical protein
MPNCPARPGGDSPKKKQIPLSFFNDVFDYLFDN